MDIRLLAQVTAPALPDYSLEGLAGWFGVKVTGRHRALGDAATAARIFIALAPRLRDAGIHTVGQAQAACRNLAQAPDVLNLVGGFEAATGLPADYPGRYVRNIYPYRHRVHEVMSSPPAFSAEDATMAEALADMIDQQVSSRFVGSPESPAATLGIATERDVLRAIRTQGAAALHLPVAAIATKPLLTVPEDAFVYEAINRTRHHRIRHLGVVKEDGSLSGALSARDLLRFTDEAAVLLGYDIEEATDVPALARAWAKVPAVTADLLEGGLSGREIASIIARELAAATRRAGELAEAQLAAEEMGPPPCSYGLLVLGSAGRGESLLALDQDNAIIFANGTPGGPEDRWFEAFGARVNEVLHAIGVPLCSGGVMAREAKFRGSSETWRQRIALWIARAAPEDLLNVDIFFDFRCVLGDRRLADELWRDAWRAAKHDRAFLRLLVEAAGPFEAPIGFLGRLKTEKGRIDLKRFGLRPIVQGARFLALRHGLAIHSTADRLNRVRACSIGGERDLAGAAKAHDRFLRLILRAQLSDLAAGHPASNRVPPSVIEAETGFDQLKSDLRLAASLDELARDQVAITVA